MVFLKKLRPLLLQLLLNLFKYITFNRTEVTFFKQVDEQVCKKNCPNFIYTIELEENQSRHFPIHSYP